jgi:hypothetical protein
MTVLSPLSSTVKAIARSTQPLAVDVTDDRIDDDPTTPTNSTNTTTPAVLYLVFFRNPLYFHELMHWSDFNDKKRAQWFLQTAFVMYIFSSRVPHRSRMLT